MKVTVDSFGELKVIDNETIISFVEDPSKVFERKYDGTAGIINVDENETKIYGRGKLKDGSQQDYTATFPDLFESIEYLTTELEKERIEIEKQKAERLEKERVERELLEKELAVKKAEAERRNNHPNCRNVRRKSLKYLVDYLKIINLLSNGEK